MRLRKISHFVDNNLRLGKCIGCNWDYRHLLLTSLCRVRPEPDLREEGSPQLHLVCRDVARWFPLGLAGRYLRPAEDSDRGDVGQQRGGSRLQLQWELRDLPGPEVHQWTGVGLTPPLLIVIWPNSGWVAASPWSSPTSQSSSPAPREAGLSACWPHSGWWETSRWRA